MNDSRSSSSRLNQLLTREHLPAASALFAITIICWSYLFLLSQKMAAMSSMGMKFMPWSLPDFVLMFLMWWVMMIGMMTPSAAPMILIFKRVNDNRHKRGRAFVPTSIFAGGYLAIWSLFSLIATLAQWLLESAALMMPMMHLVSAPISGAVLIVAGLYQFSSLKQVCLKNCRSPFAFVMNHWRDGLGGALRMGVGHGLYCLGCCWFLMALLFVGGVMDLLWVAIIAAYVLAEKLFPQGEWIARIAGVAMIAFGLYRLL